MTRASSADFQGAMTTKQHDVPLKPVGGEPATTFRTYVASPFPIASSLCEAATIAAELLATFDLTKEGVSKKHRETEAFLERHLREHAATWHNQQALVRKFFP